MWQGETARRPLRPSGEGKWGLLLRQANKTPGMGIVHILKMSSSGPNMAGFLVVQKARALEGPRREQCTPLIDRGVTGGYK